MKDTTNFPIYVWRSDSKIPEKGIVGMVTDTPKGLYVMTVEDILPGSVVWDLPPDFWEFRNLLSEEP